MLTATVKFSEEKLIKLTDSNGHTYGGTQWGEGVEYTVPGNGPLCSGAWIHAYRDLHLAVAMNPAHGGWQQPLGWEADGVVGIDDGTKVGCTVLRTVRRTVLPVISTNALVRWAIYCARLPPQPARWENWAAVWLSGEDRTARAAAEEAAAAASGAAASAPPDFAGLLQQAIREHRVETPRLRKE